MPGSAPSLAPHSVPDGVKQLLIEGLIAPYKAKARRSPHELPGLWYGLDEIGVRHPDGDLFVHEIVFRMDEQLCDALRVHASSRLTVFESNGTITDVCVDGFNHKSQDVIAEISEGLEMCITQLILATEQ